MLKKLLTLIHNFLLKLISGLKRFPGALALACAVTVVLMYINHAKPREDVWAHTAMVLALGIPAALCIKMVFERITVKKAAAVLVYALAAGMLLGYYFFLLPDMGMVSVSRYIAFSLALYLLFTAIPYWGCREGYELYVIKLFTGFIVTYFYSLILFAGLAAILFTVNTLFSAGISSKVYFDLWLFVAGIFAPAYFLAEVPAAGARYSGDDYPQFLKVLLLYIVMPLLVVYTGILYVYFLKILVTRIWPAGIVSNLVLWYSFISLAVLFFIYILREKNTWVRIFTAFFPKLIVPLLLMMFIAMGIRIDAYGITENRFLVLTGGLWSTGCMLYLACKKNTRNILLVLSAAVIAVLVVSGPWSCYSVSKYSQNARFESLLMKNNMVSGGSIVPAQEISTADKANISSIIQYFNRYHSLKELKMLPPGFKLAQMKETFGFERSFGSKNEYFGHNLQETWEMQDIMGYDYFLASPVEMPGNTTVNQGALGIAYDNAARVIKISEEGRLIYQKDITEAALAIHAANTGKNALTNREMTFMDENENLKIMVLFRNMSGTEDGGDGKPRVEWLDFFLFVKLK